MLLRFGVSNHLSVRDLQELSLLTSSLKDDEMGLIDCAAVPKGSVLPAAVIYGANASGKSNLIDALFTMRAMVLWSQNRGKPEGDIPHHPFLLDKSSSKNPSHFDIDFVIDGVRHHYGFEVSDTAVEAEWLYSFPRSYRRMLFEREGLKFRFGRELKGQNKNISGLTRPNSLFVSAAAQNSHRQLSKIYGYFQSIQTIRDIVIPTAVVNLQLIGEDEKGLDKRVINFLEEIDTGVIDVRQIESEFPEGYRTFQRELFALFTKVMDEPVDFDSIANAMRVEIELGHQGLNGQTFYLELDRESAGTRRLLIVLSHVFRALDEGVLLFIDELDSSLHTHACEAVLKLFCTRKINQNGAQLVVTTHDTHLMKSKVLRRDQLWFTEKGVSGATKLYPLSDIRTRKDDNIEKGYLDGRFGAVPSGDPIYSFGAKK